MFSLFWERLLDWRKIIFNPELTNKQHWIDVTNLKHSQCRTVLLSYLRPIIVVIIAIQNKGSGSFKLLWNQGRNGRISIPDHLNRPNYNCSDLEQEEVPSTNELLVLPAIIIWRGRKEIWPHNYLQLIFLIEMNQHAWYETSRIEHTQWSDISRKSILDHYLNP